MKRALGAVALTGTAAAPVPIGTDPAELHRHGLLLERGDQLADDARTDES